MSIELPTWLLAASYALVGWNVGLRFTPALIHAPAPCRACSPASSHDRRVRRRRLADGLAPASIR
jgi:hypothetical protein